jgi:hypothetical protein
MQSRARLTVLSLVLTVLAACGGAEPPRDKASQEQAKAEADAKGRDTDATVVDDLVQTEDRARGVEATTMASKAATDAAIDQQTGDASPDPQQ